MLAEAGSFLAGLALAVALYAAFAAFWGIRQADSRWALSARNGVYATAALLVLALLILLAAFLDDQFQIEYVYQHSSRALPLYLKVSAVWAGQEGSLLLWAFLQALFAALVVVRPSERSRPLVPWATVVLNLVTAFFVGVTSFLSNPFTLLSMTPADGQGLNPLLRHLEMVFHPPALYLGYVGLAVPFAFALAALITRRLEDWPTVARRWVLAAWLFLGLGLLLGARWAYDVLGWGGYWAWDPVENAGLMPWLTATALLHGIVMQEQRDGFRWWNVILATLSFVLVLWGTFTTRSGLIESVHAFAESTLGYYFLAFMALSLIVAAVLIIYRRRSLADPNPPGALFSRGGMFFLTLLLFLTFTATVFYGSVLPTISDTLTDFRREAGPDWFDFRTAPQFVALLLLIGVCPLLGRTASTLRRLGTRGWPALAGAVLVVVVAVLAGFTKWFSLVSFAVVGLAGGTTLAEFVRGVAARSRQEDLLRAFWNLFSRNRRKYGGYLVHVGVIFMALGIVGTRVYPFETQAVLPAGEPVDVGDYTLIFEEVQQEPAPDHVTAFATVSVYRDGAYLTTCQPQTNQYLNHDQTVAVPALRAGLREDLYLLLSGFSNVTATFKVFVNPMASFLWLGGLIFLTGGAVAVWPSSRRQSAWSVVGPVLGLLLLVAAGWAMWGTGNCAAATGRPLPGQPAPDFTLDLLDGSTLALSELRGQVAVVNFWATWCPPCEDEMPDLQAVWEEYQADGVVFVGIAYEDEEIAVREMISRFGITYPQGLDVGALISTAYGITGVPETFLVDSQGRVAGLHVGPVSAEELRGELDSLLGR